MRVAKIVAIANQKGGVGKTTTAVNLSSCVSALGKKVLIVDLDPQATPPPGYGIPKRSVEWRHLRGAHWPGHRRPGDPQDRGSAPM